MFRKLEAWLFYLLAIFSVMFAIAVGMLVRQELVGNSNPLTKAALFLAEIPDNVRFLLTDTIARPDRFPNSSGFEGTPLKEEAYLLLSRYDGDRSEALVELIDLRDFSVLHRWNPDIENIHSQVDTSEPEFSFLLRDHSEERYIITHPYLTNDGGLLFFDTSPLVKIDYCSKLVWQNQEERFHHSIERDHEGNYWVPTHMYPYAVDERYVGTNAENFLDDAITKVSANGEILFSKSVGQMFIENNLEHLLFATGSSGFNRDPIHLNDIEPVLEDGKYWNRGDLFLSMRNQSMVMLYRPSTNEILWHTTQHIRQQHDVDVLDNHTISIFNNNALDTIQGFVVDGHNEVVVYDFKNDKYHFPFNEMLIENDVKTTTAGRSNLLDNGDLFIEETYYGRTLYFSENGDLMWQHVNRAENGNVYPVRWSRILRADDDLKKVRGIIAKGKCENE